MPSINGVDLDNAPSWSGFRIGGKQVSIRGTVAEASRSAFLAAIAAGDTGLPLTLYRTCGGAADVVVSEGRYVLKGDAGPMTAEAPGGAHNVLSPLSSARHVFIGTHISWCFDGDSACGKLWPYRNQQGITVPTPPTVVRSTSVIDYGVSLGIQNFEVEGAGNDMLLAFVVTRSSQHCTGVTWKPAEADDEGDTPMVQVGSEVTIGSPAVYITAWKLFEPLASGEGGTDGSLAPSFSGGNAADAMVAAYLSGVTSSTVLSATGTAAGASISTNISSTDGSYLVIDGLGWNQTSGVAHDADPGSGQTLLQLNPLGGGAFGDPDSVLAVSSKAAATAMAWTNITSSADYTGAAHIVVGVKGID